MINPALRARSEQPKLRRLLLLLALLGWLGAVTATAQELPEPAPEEAPDPLLIKQLVERVLNDALGDFEPEATAAATTRDPTIAPVALSLLLTPMPLDALANELEAWRLVVEGRVTALSAVERALLDVNQADVAAGMPEASGDTLPHGRDTLKANADNASKQALLDRAAKLRDARSAALERLQVVLDEYETKGGDAEVIDEYAAYARAVSGINLDVSDSETAWQTLLSWVRSEQGGRELARKMGLLLLAVVVSVLIGWALSTVLNAGLKATGSASVLLRRFLRVWIRRIAMVIGVLVGLAAFDVDITPLVAGIGAAGFILAFALQNTLSNFASGLLIMLQRPFDVGDDIEAAGITGAVERVTLFSTYMSTDENKQVIVPNNMIWDGIIVNATGAPTRRLAIEFEVSAGQDIEQVEQILLQVMCSHPEVLDEPAPEVKLTSIDSEGMTFICWPWVPTAKKDRVRWELVATVAQRLQLRRGATKAGQ